MLTLAVVDIQRLCRTKRNKTCQNSQIVLFFVRKMAKLTKISSIVSSDLISSDKFRVEIIFVAVFYKINMDVSVVKIKLGSFK